MVPFTGLKLFHPLLIAVVVVGWLADWLVAGYA